MADISIRAPTRGATIWDACFHSHCFISIRAPTRGATGLYSHQNQGLSDFNPRSHEGSDANTPYCYNYSKEFQSALPRGERLGFCPYVQNLCLISIRAPTRGATWILPVCSKSLPYFNPRSHEGSDWWNPFTAVSGCYFNPRSHEGSDFAIAKKNSTIAKFQSALPRGERHGCCLFLCNKAVFQSALPRGERRLSLLIAAARPVFQSALPRGERRQ